MSRAFVNHVTKHILEYLPKEYQGAEVTVDDLVSGNDEHLTGLGVVRPGKHAGVRVYLEQFERLMRQHRFSRNFTLELIAEHIVRHDEHICEMIPETNPTYEEVRPYLRLRLHDPRLNQDFLADKPHVMLGGLAVAYRIIMPGDARNVLTIPVSDEIVEDWGGVPLEQLHADALEADAARFSAALVDPTDGPPRTILEYTNLLDLAPGEWTNPRHTRVYALTNIALDDGAAVIAREGVLDRVAEIVGGSYYLLPTSVHEIMVMPEATAESVGSMENQLSRSNMLSEKAEEVLTFSVFHYDWQKGEMSRVQGPEHRTPLS